MPSRHREQSAASVCGLNFGQLVPRTHLSEALSDSQLVVAVSAARSDGFQVADFFAESERSAHQAGTEDALADRSRRCDDQMRTQVSREHRRR